MWLYKTSRMGDLQQVYLNNVRNLLTSIYILYCRWRKKDLWKRIHRVLLCLFIFCLLWRIRIVHKYERHIFVYRSITIYSFTLSEWMSVRCSSDRMVVGFTTTCAIRAYHHCSCCEFEFRSGEVHSIQHYVIKFVSDLRQVGGFLRVLRLHPPI